MNPFISLKNDYPRLHHAAKTQLSELQSLDLTTLSNLEIESKSTLFQLKNNLTSLCAGYEVIFCPIALTTTAIPTLLQDMHTIYPHLRSAARTLTYHLHSQPIFPLPPSTTPLYLDPKTLFFYRRVIAHELAHLRSPTTTPPLFNNNTPDATLRAMLLPQHRWLLDPHSLPPLEWQALIMTAGPLKLLANSFALQMRLFRRRCADNGVAIPGVVDGRLAVEEVTRRATSAEDASECPVCLGECGVLGEGVVTRCGHVFGRGCLEGWVGMGGRSCPVCRGDLFQRGEGVLGVCRGYYGVVEEGIEEARGLGEMVGGFLEMGVREVYSLGVGDLLFRLDDLAARVRAALAEMNAAAGLPLESGLMRGVNPMWI